MEHKKYYFVLFCAIHAEIVHPELAKSSWVGVGTWSCSNQDPGALSWRQGLSVLWGAKVKLGCYPIEVQAGRQAYRETGFVALENLTQKWSVTEIKEILSF